MGDGLGAVCRLSDGVVVSAPRPVTELERRAARAKGWRWLRGMSHRTHDGLLFRKPMADPVHWEGDDYTFPDLEDPATLGCLLALVREAWGDPLIACICTGRMKTPWMMDNYTRDWPAWETEGEALVWALENAP